MIILDAYNVLHAWRNAPIQEGGADVEALARLAAASPLARDGVHLVCDGVPPTGHDSPHDLRSGPIRITYAGAGKDADSLIESLIDRSTAPTRLTVVSSDRRIQRAARRRRATAIDSHRFIAMSLSGQPADAHQTDVKPGDLSQSDVQAWLRAFELSEPPPQVPAPPTKDKSTDTESLPPLPDSIDPDDLDMSKWIDAVDPLPPTDPPP